MFVAGAIARTSAASPIQTPADAARDPLGETYTMTGTLGGELALDDVLHRLAQTAGRVQENHHRREALVVRPVDRLDRRSRR